jgi:hypothetical protein
MTKTRAIEEANRHYTNKPSAPAFASQMPNLLEKMCLVAVPVINDAGGVARIW